MMGLGGGWPNAGGGAAGGAPPPPSQPWMVEAKGPAADLVAKRMRALGYIWYADRWHPKTEALTLEFEDRFAAIPWKDAESFFKLGRWAESHADDLPAARDLSYRCYQAGYHGDANHNGIRRKLGLAPVGSGSDTTAAQAAPDGPYQHEATGTVVQGPERWKRSATPLDGDVTWVDPSSETAYISAKVVGVESAPNFEELWTRVVHDWRARQSFAELAISEPSFTGGQARDLRFSYLEGRYTRFGEIVVARQASGTAVVLTAAYAENEQTGVSAVLAQVLSHVAMTSPTGRGQPGH
jgi:hypothetical protein